MLSIHLFLHSVVLLPPILYKYFDSTGIKACYLLFKRALLFAAIAQLVCCSHCRAYEMYMRVLQDDCMIWGRKATFAEGLIK